MEKLFLSQFFSSLNVPVLALHLMDFLAIGGAFCIFFILFSFYYEETLCDFLDEHFSLKVMFYFSFLSFLVYIFHLDNIVMMIDKVFLPYIVELREFIALIGIMLLLGGLVVLSYAHVVYLLIYSIIAVLIVHAIASSFVTNFQILNAIDLITFIIVIYKKENYRLKQFLPNIYKNIKCFFNHSKTS